MGDDLNQFREDVQYRPQNIHPSDYGVIAMRGPPEWAFNEFLYLPRGVLGEAANDSERGPLIPTSFGTHIYPLERAFFSIRNRDHIMNKILEVMNKTYGINLTRQSDDSLLQLMSAVWSDENEEVSREVPLLLRSIAYLDAVVLGRAIPAMIDEYRNFKRDRQFWERNATWINDVPLPLHTAIKNEFPLMTQPFLTGNPDPRPPGASELDVGGWP